jgi:hypothetical protein
MSQLRILVCGGRDFTDYLHFAREMNAIRDEHGGFSAIIHGAAKGADWCAHLYANAAGCKANGVEEWSFPADWKTHGRVAGPLRNARMIAEGRPDLVIVFPGGRGTADMVRKALAAGIPIHVVPTPTASREVTAP